MNSFDGGNMSRSRRESVVLPDEEGPEMPMRRGDGMFTTFLFRRASDVSLQWQAL